MNQIRECKVILSENKSELHLPGEVGIWVFIFGDMLMFAAFFISYISDRSDNIELYNLSQANLSINMGVTNTLILLTSSLFVALGVNSIRKSNRKNISSMYIALAFFCGLVFIVNKYFEWSEKVGNGLTLTTNEYFIYYYVLTGIHLLHVLIGLFILAYLLYLSSLDSAVKRYTTFETGATYWHMVDLLWLVIFPLLYIVR